MHSPGAGSFRRFDLGSIRAPPRDPREKPFCSSPQCSAARAWETMAGAAVPDYARRFKAGFQLQLWARDNAQIFLPVKSSG